MKIVIPIHHPAWVYQFKYIIKELESRGHEVKVLAVKKDMNLELMEKFGIAYDKIADSTGKGIAEKLWLLIAITVKTFFKCLSFKPDCFIGRDSPMIAINCFLFRKPYIIFDDTERARVSHFFCKHLSTLFITPLSFQSDLGKVHKPMPVYKETFYLHPNRFTPDEKILSELGVSAGEKYTVIRLVSWTADHDFGHTGLSMATKLQCVKTFEKYGRVFITSETPLPKELEKYRLTMPIEKIHSVLYFASLYYGESATMASECAVLGTHAVFSYFEPLSTTTDQEKRFDLVYNFKLDTESQILSVAKGVELLRTENLWELGKKKRELLLANTLDGTEMFLKELEPYIKN